MHYRELVYDSVLSLTLALSVEEPVYAAAQAVA